jgi:hypothetical protein
MCVFDLGTRESATVQVAQHLRIRIQLDLKVKMFIIKRYELESIGAQRRTGRCAHRARLPDMDGVVHFSQSTACHPGRETI